MIYLQFHIRNDHGFLLPRTTPADASLKGDRKATMPALIRPNLQQTGRNHSIKPRPVKMREVMMKLAGDRGHDRHGIGLAMNQSRDALLRVRVKGGGRFDHVLATMTARSRAEGFGAEVQRRILIGTYALSAGYYDAFYHKAMQVRTLIQQDFVKAFEHVDVLITPTTPTTAFGIGEKSDDPLAMKLSDICTLSANLAGVPGISIPAGFDATGLPFGVQLLGPALSEALLLKVSRAYLDATHWNEQSPAL